VRRASLPTSGWWVSTICLQPGQTSWYLHRILLEEN
jgi:hypothetical protein